MIRRRLAFALAGAVVVLTLLGGLGRWERARWIDEENAKIAAVVDLIGPSYLTRTLTDFYDEREWRRLQCLRYWYGNDPYALQLCFDYRGRLVEAHDERTGEVRIADLGVEPNASRFRIDYPFLMKIRRLIIDRQNELYRIAALKRRREEARRAAEAANRARQGG